MLIRRRCPVCGHILSRAEKFRFGRFGTGTAPCADCGTPLAWRRGPLLAQLVALPLMFVSLPGLLFGTVGTVIAFAIDLVVLITIVVTGFMSRLVVVGRAQV